MKCHVLHSIKSYVVIKHHWTMIQQILALHIGRFINAASFTLEQFRGKQCRGEKKKSKIVFYLAVLLDRVKKDGNIH